MPRELITVQVGQCGNQIGQRFWDMALQEHSTQTKNAEFNESLSTFFRNVDSRTGATIPLDNGKSRIRDLEARAVLVDMEEGVVRQVSNSKLGSLFNNKCFVTGVSGSGNNWAQGYEEYGNEYMEEILDSVSRVAETCDSPQSFFVLHSLGGGTGSGLGSKVIEMLSDQVPELYRFVVPVFPSEDDDVITSPYNSVLSLSHILRAADCIVPLDNTSLASVALRARAAAAAGGLTKKCTSKPFSDMNAVAAQMLLNLTSSIRFEGSLNVDLNEISMNMVPFPNLNLLIPSLSPLMLSKAKHPQVNSLPQLFNDAFLPNNQLISADPKRGTSPLVSYLSCALLVRGQGFELSDVRRNIEKLRPSLTFPAWTDGWKIGMCRVPPVHSSHSLLCLANNTCLASTLETLLQRFNKLYLRKAHIHHYTNFMSPDDFPVAREIVRNTICEYNDVAAGRPVESATPNFHIDPI